MSEKTIQDIMNDLAVKGPRDDESRGTPLTIWVPKKDKERYQRLQKLTDRRLSKKFCELFRMALDHAEKQVS